MTAVFKREFKSYFHSFIGFLFVGVILFLTGIYVTVYNLLSGLPNISYALSAVLFVFIVSVPILTMRVLAEERKQKTDQLLLAAPISVGKIVTGKFMALAAVFSIPMGIIACYPLILNGYGAFSMRESYTAIAAFYFYGLTCISIGIFVSSLTESQVIAAVISFGLLFLGYMMSGITSIISTTGNWLTSILNGFNLVMRFDALAEGTLDVKSIVYFLTMIGVFLFLTTQMIQKRRYSVSVKKIKRGVYSVSLTAIVVAGVVFVNLFVAEIPAKYTTFDMTSQKLYSLTDETKKLLEGLTEEIKIYVLSNETSQDTTLQKTLEQYTALSDKIEVVYVDPMVEPKFYTQYTDDAISSNSLIVESGKRSKVIDYQSIYEISIDYTTYSQNVTGYDAEGQITGAVAYVISDDMPKLYLLEGHGELTFEADFYDTIEKANIEYESINLLHHESIPEDAECIVIHAPTSDFSADDTNKVLDYLKAGGNALIISTWTNEEMPNFHKILNYYEVQVEEGLVLEGDTNAYYQSPFYLLPTIAYDSLTDSVYDTMVFVPYAQGLILPDAPTDDLELNQLLFTSEDSYAETTDGENHSEGPFTLGVRAVRRNGDVSSTAVIYSSENLFTDAANVMVSGANMKLFAASLDTLVESTVNVAIPVKSYDMHYLTLNQSTIIWLGLTITIFLPFAILSGGFVIWFRRRRL